METVQTSGGSSSCAAYSTESQPWASGTGVTSSSVNLFLKNTGSSEISIPYTVMATAPGYINTQYSWYVPFSLWRVPARLCKPVLSHDAWAAAACLGGIDYSLVQELGCHIYSVRSPDRCGECG